MNPWSHVENIAIVACATFIAYKWDTAWAFTILIFMNFPNRKPNGN